MVKLLGFTSQNLVEISAFRRPILLKENNSKNLMLIICWDKVQNPKSFYLEKAYCIPDRTFPWWNSKNNEVLISDSLWIVDERLWCKHSSEASRAVCYLVWNVITVGALLSPHPLHGLRGGDVCLDVTSPSSALGSKPPSLTRIARLHKPLNSIYCLFDSTTLSKKNYNNY